MAKIWITNTKKGSDHHRKALKSIPNYFEGDARPSPDYTSKQLKDMGYIGIYQIKTDRLSL